MKKDSTYQPSKADLDEPIQIDATADDLARAVVAAGPKVQGKPLTVIAGAPDRPLVIGDIEIQCYVLEGETRVLSQRGFVQALDTHVQAQSKRLATTAAAVQVPDFLAKKNLEPFIHRDLVALYKPVLFRSPSGGGVAHGYPAKLLPLVCDVYLKAREAGKLRASQEHIAKRAEILMRGLATVGVIGLVDEATGYQEIRSKRALATILEKFIDKELQPWTKTFPYEFYEEICRLKGWPSINAVKRPSVIGKYTNDFVYERLAPGVLDELKRRNPRLPSGGRRHKHHQWFTPEYGHPKLGQHLAAVVALMKASTTWSGFKQLLNRAFTKRNTTIPLPLED